MMKIAKNFCCSMKEAVARFSIWLAFKSGWEPTNVYVLEGQEVELYEGSFSHVMVCGGGILVVHDGVCIETLINNGGEIDFSPCYEINEPRRPPLTVFASNQN